MGFEFADDGAIGGRDGSDHDGRGIVDLGTCGRCLVSVRDVVVVEGLQTGSVASRSDRR